MSDTSKPKTPRQGDNRRNLPHGGTSQIGDALRDVVKGLAPPDTAPAADAKPRTRGIGGKCRLLLAVLVHPDLDGQDWLGLAVVYALPSRGPDAGLRGGLSRLCRELGGTGRRWRKRLRQWERMRLVRRVRIKGERAARIVRTKTIPRPFLRALPADWEQRAGQKPGGVGGRRPDGVARLGFCDVPAALVTDTSLSLSARAVWARLYDLTTWGDFGRPFLSMRKIAWRLSMGQREVRHALAELVERQLIEQDGTWRNKVRAWAVRRGVGGDWLGAPPGTGAGAGPPVAGENEGFLWSAPRVPLERTKGSSGAHSKKHPLEHPLRNSGAALRDCAREGAHAETAGNSGPTGGPDSAREPYIRADGSPDLERELRRQMARVRADQAVQGKGPGETPAGRTPGAWAEAAAALAKKIHGPKTAQIVLATLGVTPREAPGLVKRHGWETVRGAVLLLAERSGAGRVIGNPAGWLTKALREDWRSEAPRASASDSASARRPAGAVPVPVAAAGASDSASARLPAGGADGGAQAEKVRATLAAWAAHGVQVRLAGMGVRLLIPPADIETWADAAALYLTIVSDPAGRSALDTITAAAGLDANVRPVALRIALDAAGLKVQSEPAVG